MSRNVDEEKVKKQAKQILDKFASALEKVEKEELEESFVDREEFERAESQGEESSKDFKQRILENAPRKDSDFIIAEKGSWK